MQTSQGAQFNKCKPASSVHLGGYGKVASVHYHLPGRAVLFVHSGKVEVRCTVEKSGGSVHSYMF